MTSAAHQRIDVVNTQVRKENMEVPPIIRQKMEAAGRMPLLIKVIEYRNAPGEAEFTENGIARGCLTMGPELTSSRFQNDREKLIAWNGGNPRGSTLSDLKKGELWTALFNFRRILSWEQDANGVGRPNFHESDHLYQFDQILNEVDDCLWRFQNRGREDPLVKNSKLLSAFLRHEERNVSEAQRLPFDAGGWVLLDLLLWKFYRQPPAPILIKCIIANLKSRFQICVVYKGCHRGSTFEDWYNSLGGDRPYRPDNFSDVYFYVRAVQGHSISGIEDSVAYTEITRLSAPRILPNIHMLRPVHCTSREASEGIMSIQCILPGGPNLKRNTVHFSLRHPADVGEAVLSGAHHHKEIWWVLDLRMLLETEPPDEIGCSLSSNNVLLFSNPVHVKYMRAIDFKFKRYLWLPDADLSRADLALNEEDQNILVRELARRHNHPIPPLIPSRRYDAPGWGQGTGPSVPTQAQGTVDQQPIREVENCPICMDHIPEDSPFKWTCDHCTCKIHYECYQAMLCRGRQVNGDVKCPNCRTLIAVMNNGHLTPYSTSSQNLAAAKAGGAVRLAIPMKRPPTGGAPRGTAGMRSNLMGAMHTRPGSPRVERRVFELDPQTGIRRVVAVSVERPQTEIVAKRPPPPANPPKAGNATATGVNTGVWGTHLIRVGAPRVTEEERLNRAVQYPTLIAASSSYTSRRKMPPMPKDPSSIPFKAEPPEPSNVVTSGATVDPPPAKALASIAVAPRPPPPRVARMWQEMFVENENWGTSPVANVDDAMIEAFITENLGIDFSPYLFQRRELKRLCEIEANLRHAIAHAREAISPSTAVNLDDLDDSLIRRIRIFDNTLSNMLVVDSRAGQDRLLRMELDGRRDAIQEFQRRQAMRLEEARELYDTVLVMTISASDPSEVPEDTAPGDDVLTSAVDGSEPADPGPEPNRRPLPSDPAPTVRTGPDEFVDEPNPDLPMDERARNVAMVRETMGSSFIEGVGSLIQQESAMSSRTQAEVQLSAIDDPHSRMTDPRHVLTSMEAFYAVEMKVMPEVPMTESQKSTPIMGNPYSELRGRFSQIYRLVGELPLQWITGQIMAGSLHLMNGTQPPINPSTPNPQLTRLLWFNPADPGVNRAAIRDLRDLLITWRIDDPVINVICLGDTMPPTSEQADKESLTTIVLEQFLMTYAVHMGKRQEASSANSRLDEWCYWFVLCVLANCFDSATLSSEHLQTRAALHIVSHIFFRAFELRRYDWTHVVAQLYTHWQYGITQGEEQFRYWFGPRFIPPCEKLNHEFVPSKPEGPCRLYDEAEVGVEEEEWVRLSTVQSLRLEEDVSPATGQTINSDTSWMEVQPPNSESVVTLPEEEAAEPKTESVDEEEEDRAQETAAADVASFVRDRPAPTSPTEMPVPTDLPSPTTPPAAASSAGEVKTEPAASTSTAEVKTERAASTSTTKVKTKQAAASSSTDANMTAPTGGASSSVVTPTVDVPQVAAASSTTGGASSSVVTPTMEIPRTATESSPQPERPARRSDATLEERLSEMIMHVANITDGSVAHPVTDMQLKDFLTVVAEAHDVQGGESVAEKLKHLSTESLRRIVMAIRSSSLGAEWENVRATARQVQQHFLQEQVVRNRPMREKALERLANYGASNPEESMRAVMDEVSGNVSYSRWMTAKSSSCDVMQTMISFYDLSAMTEKNVDSYQAVFAKGKDSSNISVLINYDKPTDSYATSFGPLGNFYDEFEEKLKTNRVLLRTHEDEHTSLRHLVMVYGHEISQKYADRVKLERKREIRIHRMAEEDIYEAKGCVLTLTLPSIPPPRPEGQDDTPNDADVDFDEDPALDPVEFSGKNVFTLALMEYVQVDPLSMTYDDRQNMLQGRERLRTSRLPREERRGAWTTRQMIAQEQKRMHSHDITCLTDELVALMEDKVDLVFLKTEMTLLKHGTTNDGMADWREDNSDMPKTDKNQPRATRSWVETALTDAVLEYNSKNGLGYENGAIAATCVQPIPIQGIRELTERAENAKLTQRSNVVMVMHNATSRYAPIHREKAAGVLNGDDEWPLQRTKIMMPFVRGHWGVSFPGDDPDPEQKHRDLAHLRQSICTEEVQDPDDDDAVITVKMLPSTMGVADYAVRIIATGVNQTALDFGLDIVDEEWRCPVNLQITPSIYGGARQRSQYGNAIHNLNSETMRTLRAGKAGSPRGKAPSEVTPVQQPKAKLIPADQRQIIVEARTAAQKATSAVRAYTPTGGMPWATMNIAPPPEPGSTTTSSVVQRAQAAAAKSSQGPPSMSPPPKADRPTVKWVVANETRLPNVVTSETSAPAPKPKSRGPRPPPDPPPTRLRQGSPAASSSNRVVTSGQDAAPKGKNPSRAKTPTQAGSPWQSSAVREHRSRSNRAQREHEDQPQDREWREREWRDQGWNSRYGRWWESDSSWSSRRSGPW